MKKFFVLMLALVMALSLVACGSKADTTADDKTDDPATAEAANALEKIKADGVLTVTLTAECEQEIGRAQATPDAEFLQLRPPAGEGTAADD